MIQPKYHVFVCTSSKITGQQKGFCEQKGGVQIVQNLMELIEEFGLSGEVTVNNTGCFAVCDKGPIMVVYPEGIWYGGVTPDDVEEIVESHFENGVPVERLMLK